MKKKYLKFIILPLICIVVVGITFYMIFDMRKKIEEEAYDVQNITDTNTVENVADTNEMNVVDNTTNTATENVVKESTENVTSTSEPAETSTISTSTSQQVAPSSTTTATQVYEQNSDVGSTDRKQDAIELVKQKWGEDTTVTFRCDSVTGSGEYVIAVIDNATGNVRNYFKVNLKSKTVEVDY